MKTGVFSVYDMKMTVFGQPFFIDREQGAIRVFGDWVNDPQTPLNKHPEDYSLYHIGDFDNDTGELVPVKPRSLVQAAAVIKTALEVK